MIRRTVLMAVAGVALLLGSFSAPASADPEPTVGPTPTPPICLTVNEYNKCLAYPDGGFGDGNAGAGTPTATPTPRPFPTATPATDAAAAANAPDAAQIAFTGAESRVLGYVGAGFIGFGAVALAAARRKQESDAS